MKITFKLEDSQHVKIMCNGKEIGRIFSPSGSGEDCENAIQVCGFSEAFDYWGCGQYAEINWIRVPQNTPFQKQTIQVRDIQLMFKENVEPHTPHNITKNCPRCFNEPCTCEHKTDAMITPYMLKRGKDLPIEYVVKPMKLKDAIKL